MVCSKATPTARSSPARICLTAELSYPLLWEHKALNAKTWRALERDGLEKDLPAI